MVTYMRLLLTFCLALICCFGFSEVASARTVQLAVQDDTVLLGGHGALSRSDALDRLQQLHVRQVRFNVPWTKVLASDPNSRSVPSGGAQYNWSQYDEAIAAVQARGIAVQLTLTLPAPAWATATHQAGVTRVSPTAFAAFAAAAAAHFAQVVKQFSVLNEPNWPTTFIVKKLCSGKGKHKKCVDGRPAAYRVLYTKAYTAIHRANRSAQVWIGELAPQGRLTASGRAMSPIKFLRETLCLNAKGTKKSCAGMRAEGVAVHPYYLGKSPKSSPPNRDDLSMAALPRLTSFLQKAEKTKALRQGNGKSNIPVYLTEFGYITNNTSRGVTVAQQATYTQQAVALATKNKRVKQLLMYQLIDADNPDVSWQSGLLYGNGQPKPVWNMMVGLTSYFD